MENQTMSTDRDKSAIDPRKRPGKGGNIPPAPLFVPGNSGGKGRPKNLGSSVQEQLNAMATWTEAEIRRVARLPGTPANQRIAAGRLLRAMDAGDLSEFEAYLDGSADLRELSKRVNTDVVKRAKVRVRRDREGETIEREIELHDRAPAAFDQIMDRTIGRPNQSIDLTGAPPVNIQIVVPVLPPED